MASKPKSKWADDDEDEQAAIAQRKREKEEKRRLKENRARRVPSPVTAPESSAAVNDINHNENERPTKRLRMSTSPERPSPDPGDEEEEANLIQFPSRSFGPCEEVQKYELLNSIEEGSYGWVSRAKSRANGEIVALKRLKMDNANDGFPVTGLREIQTLMACRHVNVVNLREVVVDHNLKE